MIYDENVVGISSNWWYNEQLKQFSIAVITRNRSIVKMNKGMAKGI